MFSKLLKIPIVLQSEGIKGLLWRFQLRFTGNTYLNYFQKQYEDWYLVNGIHTINHQKVISEVKSLNNLPIISIITPVYNTNPKYLRECIQSVINQIYTNWQLVLVDDCSTDPQIWSILNNYAQLDTRITIKRLHKNSHICVATNEGLKLAKGTWIALLDHDDVLWPHALSKVIKIINEKPHSQFIYSDEDKIDEDGRTHCEPFFKPDWSPHFLMSCNYITHLAVFKYSLIKKVGGFRKGTQGAQDWDIFLRICDEINGYSQHPWDAHCPIQHINSILYSWRKSSTSTASEKHALSAKGYAYAAQKDVLKNSLSKRGGGSVSQSRYLGVWKLLPKICSQDQVSIIIPTKDNLSYLEPCLKSIWNKTTYPNYEIIIIDTGSKQTEVFDFYRDYKSKLSVIQTNHPEFNYSRAVNEGARKAKGKYLLFLNDDTEIKTPTWLEQLLSYAQLSEVGAVGCRLLYPNGKIQHTGLVVGHEQASVLGEQGFVSPYFRLADPLRNYGISTLLIDSIRDITAVTAACMMISSEKHSRIGGFDESLAIAFNDVDYCLRLLDEKLFNLMLPQVVLNHAESISLGKPGELKRDLALFASEIRKMKKRWGKKLEIDSFYSRHYNLDGGKASISVD